MNSGKFLDYLKSKLARPVLMAARGTAKVRDVVVSDVFDCSGLVTSAIFGAGGADLRPTHRAQTLADESVETQNPQEGDLVFYGSDWQSVIHVAVWLSGGRVLSANGATHTITDLTEAINQNHRIEIEPSVHFRKDFLGIKTNKWILSEAKP